MPQSKKRTGSQIPRIRVTPPSIVDTQDGKDAAKLCSEYWFTPDKWQENILKDWLGRDKDGHLATITAGLSVPRQNGKNGCIEALEFYLLLTDPNTHILHTAHQVKTCKRAFKRLKQAFTNTDHPEICSFVETVRSTNGEEGIFLTNGASIEYSARSRSAARGFDKISLVVFDEAQELLDEQVEALLFTLGASETDRAMIYTGTPPDPEKVYAEVFPRMRKRILEHPTPHSSWHEWSIETLPKKDVTYDELTEELYLTNPALGKRLSFEFGREAFTSSSLKGFCREALGYWEDISANNAAIPKQLWDASTIESIGDKYRYKTALAVKFSVDGSQYALAGAKMNKHHEIAFELIAVDSTAQGTRELAQKLADRQRSVACVSIDGQAGAEALVNDLVDAGVKRGYVMRPNARDVIGAAVTLISGLKDTTIKHTHQKTLAASALGCTKRIIGQNGGWSFGSTDAASSIAIEAAAMAVFVVKTTKRNPKRKQVLL